MEHRCHRANPVGEEGQELISKLRSAIQTNSLDLSCSAIIDLWNLYAGKSNDVKHIPKLFASKSFQPIYRSIIANVVALERLGTGLANCAIAVSSGGNILISGVRGVGKTTLMTGLVFILSIACQNVFPIYWDYENMDCKLPAQIIQDRLRQRRTDVYDAVKDNTDCIIKLLRKLQSKGIYVAFFADEVQNLYKADLAHDSLEVRCVKQLLSIGKEPNCFGVISSSSADFPSLAYKRSTKNSHQFHDYPNLNSTVYVFHRLLPIREQEELHNYSRVRYPDVVVQTETVFMKTGGLARSIDQLIIGNIQTNINTALQLPAFRAVAHRLFLNNQDLVQGTSTPWKQTALHHSEVLGAMQPLVAEDDRERLLNEWIDTGLLYSNNCHYELLVPNAYQAIRDCFENNSSI